MSIWLGVVGALFVTYALASKRLSTTAITGPMLFVTAGFLLGTAGLGVLETEPTDGRITILLEATLAIVLFSDAAVINSSNWRSEAYVPGRLLFIGLPLTVLVGMLIAGGMFPELGIWEVGLIAAILAPTDAALGQAVVSNPRVPQLIRQGLSTESGLNDGIALTFVVIFLAGAEGSLAPSAGDLLGFLGQEIVLAVAIGVGVGWLGGRALVGASERGWVAPIWLQIGTLSVGITAYGFAVPAEASGFIAAWIAGLTVGRVTRDRLQEVNAFSETLGSALTMMSFLAFGAVLLPPAVEEATWSVLVYAVLSLTIIRMLPVALSMIGTTLRRPTITFMGWFGPRGIASMVLASLVAESTGLVTIDLVVTVSMVTVALSVFAHGATSWNGSESYGSWCEENAEAEVEKSEAETPARPVPHRFRSPGMSP
ncbi:MAG: sodium:proton antiporter [Acidimicrobiia bacterium]|nr:sodium:proton antiporter [Acidimicrobiia bacterium]